MKIISAEAIKLASPKSCHIFQIHNLLNELQDTRRASPNAALRQLDALQSQIRMLDFRQKSREDKLNKVVASSADEYLKAEIASLHKTVSKVYLLASLVLSNP